VSPVWGNLNDHDFCSCAASWESPPSSSLFGSCCSRCYGWSRSSKKKEQTTSWQPSRAEQSKASRKLVEAFTCFLAYSAVYPPDSELISAHSEEIAELARETLALWDDRFPLCTSPADHVVPMSRWGGLLSPARRSRIIPSCWTRGPVQSDCCKTTDSNERLEQSTFSRRSWSTWRAIPSLVNLHQRPRSWMRWLKTFCSIMRWSDLVSSSRPRPCQVCVAKSRLKFAQALEKAKRNSPRWTCCPVSGLKLGSKCCLCFKFDWFWLAKAVYLAE